MELLEIEGCLQLADIIMGPCPCIVCQSCAGVKRRFGAAHICQVRQLGAVQSGDEGVALESCEFWSAFCEAAVSQPETLSPDVLRPFLGRLVPVLLKNMVSTSASMFLSVRRA